MAYVLSIIANPVNPVIDADLKARVAGLAANTGVIDLAAGAACDFYIAERDDAMLEAARDMLAEWPVDINIIDRTHRRKKLLVADMDSTIIEQECIDEIAEFAGRRTEISAITERAMRGDLSFEAALIERVAMLKGLDVSVLEETYAKHITLTPGARTLVQTMNKFGAVTALVSGGFTFFTERIALAAGFKSAQANALLVEDGVLTGKVRQPILGRAAKQNALLRLAGQNHLRMEETLAVGDGANDLSMLERAGLGVAFRAKPAVAEAAAARIQHGVLTALLYLQGVARADFVD